MKRSFDPLDMALFVVTMVSAFIIVGIGSFDLFNVSFSETVFTFSGYEFSTAWAMAVGSIALTIITNDNTDFSSLRDDVSNLDQYYAAAVVGTIALVVAWPFVAAVPEFFQSEDLWGVAYVGVVSTGQFAIGWML